MQHIELHRRFIEVQDNSQDPESRRELAALGYSGFSWEELLQYPRVVILAEAGMGKTEELKAQTEKLFIQGHYAFFCRIEDIAEEGLEASIDVGADFQNWLNSGEVGYFFLDSVDEAKLYGKHLRSIFRKLARSLGNTTERAIIVITSRISDWEPLTDLQEFGSKLPPDIVQISSQDKSRDNDRNEVSRLTTSKPPKDKPLVVELASLSRDQQRVFAEAQGVKELDEFFEAIYRSNSYIFAQRPEDLLELTVYWKQFGKLGSHEEMHEFNVSTKLEERDKGRTRTSNLSKQKKLEGVCFLAAALTLCKKSSISVPESIPDARFRTSAIQPQEILFGWSNSDLNALLQCPIFDQETYGRIRFHHRSIREYLTACWFRVLLDEGVSVEEVKKLFFKEIYGEKVVTPSLRYVVAWLSLWNQDFRQETLAISPDILLEGGDSAALPVETREYLLRRYATQVLDKKHIDTDIGFSEICRFSHPDLAEVISELLSSNPQHETIKHLLLRMIAFGNINQCSDQVQDLVFDTKEDVRTRVLAIEALSSIGTEPQKRQLVKVIIDNAESWAEDLVDETISQLFPEYIAVEELLSLIPRVQYVSKERIASGILFTLINISRKSNLIFEREKFLTGLVELVKREPFLDEDAFISQQYYWLCSVIAVLLDSILPNEISDCIFEAIEIVGIAKDHSLLDLHAQDSLKNIISAISGHRALNLTLFWRAVRRERIKSEKRGHRLSYWYHAQDLTSMWVIKDEYFHNFLQDIHSQPEMDDRLVALTAAFTIWKRNGQDDGNLRLLHATVGNEKELQLRLSELLMPSKSESELELEKEHKVRIEAIKRKREKQESERKEAELNFIKKLQANPERLYNSASVSGSEAFSDLYNMVNYIQFYSKESGSSYSDGLKDWQLLIPTFGQQVAESTRKGLLQFWRNYKPPLCSEESTEGVTNGTKVGLSGIAIESQAENWADDLTDQEVELAARYALQEINHFPNWIETLWNKRSETLDEIFTKELVWQLKSEDKISKRYFLDRLEYSSDVIRDHFRPKIFKLLQQNDPYHLETLDAALNILMPSPNLDVKAMANLAQERFLASREERRKLNWLTVLMFVQAEFGLQALKGWLDSVDEADQQDKRMLNFLGFMMPMHSFRFRSIWRDFESLQHLVDLIHLTFCHVRPEDDNVHDGVYSPDARDEAERVRGYLIKVLIDKPGRATYDCLLELQASNIPLPDYFRDRLPVLAYERAAKDSEFEPFQVTDFINYYQMLQASSVITDQGVTIVNQEFNFDQRGANIGVNVANEGSNIRFVQHAKQTINISEQDLAEAAKKIQALLNQLSQSYPTTTEAQQTTFIQNFLNRLDSMPALIKVLLSGGVEGIKILLPPAGIPIEMSRSLFEALQQRYGKREDLS